MEILTQTLCIEKQNIGLSESALNIDVNVTQTSSGIIGSVISVMEKIKKENNGS